MRKISLVCVGNLKEKFWAEAFLEYKKRLSKFFDFNLIELPEARLQKNNSSEIARVIEAEGDKILEKVKGKMVVALAVEGRQMDSVQFAKFVATNSDLGEICFVIGGSYGLDNRVKALGKKISFSALTFPHQLMRVILMEQLYRAGTIINNIEYHK